MSRRKEARRQFVRAEVNWPVDVEANKDTLKGRIKNISRGGALIYLNKRLDINDQVRLGIEIPEYEDVIFAKGIVVRSFSAETDSDIDSFYIGVKFTEISNEDLRYFTGNLAEEWREDYQESTAYQIKKRYLKPAIYGIAVVFLVSIALYALKFRNGDQLGRERIIDLNNRIVALEAQLVASRSNESNIARLENNFHEIQGQLVSIQRKLETFATIDNLQIQNKQFDDEVATLKKSIEHSMISEKKIVPDEDKKPAVVYHIVESGDNLYRISLKYNIHVNKIKELNKISENDSIHPGQKLIVGWQ